MSEYGSSAPMGYYGKEIAHLREIAGAGTSLSHEEQTEARVLLGLFLRSARVMEARNRHLTYGIEPDPLAFDAWNAYKGEPRTKAEYTPEAVSVLKKHNIRLSDEGERAGFERRERLMRKYLPGMALERA